MGKCVYINVSPLDKNGNGTYSATAVFCGLLVAKMVVVVSWVCKKSRFKLCCYEGEFSALCLAIKKPPESTHASTTQPVSRNQMPMHFINMPCYDFTAFHIKSRHCSKHLRTVLYRHLWVGGADSMEMWLVNVSGEGVVCCNFEECCDSTMY